jgi:hypothetical protein
MLPMHWALCRGSIVCLPFLFTIRQKKRFGVSMYVLLFTPCGAFCMEARII